MPAVKMDARAVSKYSTVYYHIILEKSKIFICSAILRGLSKNCHLQAIEFEGLSDLVAKKLPRVGSSLSAV